MPELLRLPWDSDFFGFPVGRIGASTLDETEANAVVAEARHSGYRCVYFLADGNSPESWEAAAAAGFVPVDIRLRLELVSPIPGSRPSLASAADESQLVAIAQQQTFSASRFYRDTHFPREKATEMFVIWTRRGLTEDSWFTVVERTRGGIEGYVTSRIAGEHGSIELVAVASEARGRGVGRKIVTGALAEFAARGATAVSVVTQGSNVAAQRLYGAAGFTPSHCDLWFHWWSVAVDDCGSHLPR